jgi:hypothetical protein
MARVANMTTPPPFEDWKHKQDVKYKLVVEVNDTEVFSSEYASADDLYEEARKPERAVEAELQEQYDYEFKQGRWEEDDDEDSDS